LKTFRFSFLSAFLQQWLKLLWNSELVDLALQAQGSNFGNNSRATFTSQAFKKALNDALAQAGM